MSEEFVLDPETLEKLAEAVHQVWMEGKLRDGWIQGDTIDKEKKNTHLPCPLQSAE